MKSARDSAAAVPTSPIAWLIAPAGLFFLVFFVLPFGLMALLSVMSGNPLQRPNVGVTSRHYARIAEDTLYSNRSGKP